VTSVGFRARLAALGIVRVHFAYYWFDDENRVDVRAFDAHGTPVDVHGQLVWDIREALDSRGFGSYRWDVQADVVEPYGRIDFPYAEQGSVEVVYDEDEHDLLRRVGAWRPEDGADLLEAWARAWNPAVRATLAANPRVPSVVRTPLLGDLQEVVRNAAARFVPTHVYLELQSMLSFVREPDHLPMVLRSFASSEYALVREAVAGNPSASSGTLRDLARDMWGVRLAVLNNPSCPPDLRAALLAELAATPEPRLRRWIAEHDHVPWELLRCWRGDADVGVRERVAMSANTPLEAVHTFMSDPHERVRLAANAALHERVDADANDTDESELDLSPEGQWRAVNTARRGHADWLLAQRPELLPEILEVFVNDPDRASYVASRSDLSEAQFERILDVGLDTARAYLAGNPALPARFLPRLAEDEDESVRRVVAQRNGLPARLRARLSQDASRSVRSQVATHPQTDTALLRELADDAVPLVARAVLENPRVTPEVAHAVLTRPDAPDALPWTLQGASPEVLGVVATFATGERLVALAANPRTPNVDIVPRLRALQSAGVDAVRALVDDPGTPAEVLARLVGSPHDERLLAHAHVNVEVVSQLVRAWRRRAQVFSNWDEEQLAVLQMLLDSPHFTEEHALAVLDAHAAPRARVLIARHERVTEPVLRRLFEDPHPDVAAAVASHPNLPADLVAILAEDSDEHPGSAFG